MRERKEIKKGEVREHHIWGITGSQEWMEMESDEGRKSGE